MAGRHRLEPASRRTPLLPALAVLGVVAVVAAVVAIALGGRGGTDQSARLSTAGTPTASASVSASPTPTPSPTARRTSAAPRPAKARHTLVITVTGRASYVDVRLPGRPPFLANTYPHGRRFVFDQPVLDVVIGDAGAVRLEANGRVKSPAGSPGQVLRFRVTRTR